MHTNTSILNEITYSDEDFNIVVFSFSMDPIPLQSTKEQNSHNFHKQ